MLELTPNGTQGLTKRIASAAPVAVIVPIAFLVLAQGGFFDLAVCAVGVVTSVIASVVWMRRSRRMAGIPLVPLLLTGLSLAYVASALANGASLTTLGEAGCWAACAAYSYVVAAQSSEQRRGTLVLLAYFGIATAVAGVLVSAGMLSLAGGMVEDRLQFSFQYANAAAAWYGVCTFLCLLSGNKMLRSLAALPATAFLLTESGGALVVFVIVAIAVGFRYVRVGAWDFLLQALVQAMLAAALFAVTRAVGGAYVLVAIGMVSYVCYRMAKGSQLPTGPLNARASSLVLLVVLALVAALGCGFLSERVAQALASVVERTYHVRDGLMLWSMSPMLGIGPNNWQYLYQYIQTAPYYTAVVHSSLVQLLVDAGLCGLAFLVAACAVGTKALVRNVREEAATSVANGWDQAQLAAAAFALLHSVIEFDLQFGALAFVLVLLLSSPDGPMLRHTLPADAPANDAESAARSPARAVAASMPVAGICSLVLLCSCMLGLVCAAWSAAISSAVVAGDYTAVERLYESNPFAKNDVGAQDRHLVALFDQGRYDEAAKAYALMPAPTDDAAAYAAIANFERGRIAQAVTILAERLEAQQHNVDFCNTAEQLVATYGMDPSLNTRFRSAVGRVRSNASARV